MWQLQMGVPGNTWKRRHSGVAMRHGTAVHGLALRIRVSSVVPMRRPGMADCCGGMMRCRLNDMARLRPHRWPYQRNRQNEQGGEKGVADPLGHGLPHKCSFAFRRNAPAKSRLRLTNARARPPTGIDNNVPWWRRFSHELLFNRCARTTSDFVLTILPRIVWRGRRAAAPPDFSKGWSAIAKSLHCQWLLPCSFSGASKISGSASPSTIR